MLNLQEIYENLNSELKKTRNEKNELENALESKKSACFYIKGKIDMLVEISKLLDGHFNNAGKTEENNEEDIEKAQ